MFAAVVVMLLVGNDEGKGSQEECKVKLWEEVNKRGTYDELCGLNT